MSKASGMHAWILAAAVSAAAAGCQSDWTLNEGVVDGSEVVGDEGPTPVVRGIALPREMQVDRGTVFWVSDDGVWSAPATGGEPTLLSGSVGPYTIAVNRDFVFWFDRDGGLRRRARNGDDAGVDVEVVGGVTGHDLTFSGDFLYWNTGTEVMRVSRTATGVEAERASETVPGWSDEGLVVDEDSIFLGVGGAVYRTDRSGDGDWSVFVHESGLSYNRLYGNATDLFLSSPNEEIVRRASKDGTRLEVFQSWSQVNDMAFDDQFAYWTGSDRCITRQSLLSGAWASLDRWNWYCRQIAVDDAWVYWAGRDDSGDLPDGTYGIYRVPLSDFDPAD